MVCNIFLRQLSVHQYGRLDNDPINIRRHDRAKPSSRVKLATASNSAPLIVKLATASKYHLKTQRLPSSRDKLVSASKSDLKTQRLPSSRDQATTASKSDLKTQRLPSSRDKRTTASKSDLKTQRLP